MKLPERSGSGHRRHPGYWVALTVVPFGLLTWAGFLVAGIRAQYRRWKVWAAVYAAVAVSVFPLESIVGDNGTMDDLRAAIWLALWLFGMIHAFTVRGSYVRRMDSVVDAVSAARGRLQTRREALELVQREPEVAREAGVGRPDLPGAMDAGLVDVNHVPRQALERLPGIDPVLALRIVEVREELDGFSSLADFGMTLDLEGHEVERLRELVVFLPR